MKHRQGWLRRGGWGELSPQSGPCAQQGLVTWGFRAGGVGTNGPLW